MELPRRCKVKSFQKAISACCLVSSILWARGLQSELHMGCYSRKLRRQGQQSCNSERKARGYSSNLDVCADETSNCPLSNLLWCGSWLVIVVVYFLFMLVTGLVCTLVRVTSNTVSKLRWRRYSSDLTNSTLGDVDIYNNAVDLVTNKPSPVDTPPQVDTSLYEEQCPLQEVKGKELTNLDPITAGKIAHFLSLPPAPPPEDSPLDKMGNLSSTPPSVRKRWGSHRHNFEYPSVHEVCLLRAFSASDRPQGSAGPAAAAKAVASSASSVVAAVSRGCKCRAVGLYRRLKKPKSEVCRVDDD